ncbi:MAG TPA: 1-acyl-sn-glycerol-3-phosphate acyltransferase [Pseudonocardiaceae bacterium]|nr:1-acyl-sn-glycerol-3-phosphate acyltransferase [Pseudonocardiaceae bacterium]
MLRRSVLIPLVVCLEVLLLVTSPVSLAIAALAGAAARSTRPVRSLLVVLAYAAIELRLLSRMRHLRDDEWDTLPRDVLGTAYRALRAILDVRVALEEGSVDPEQLAATGRPLVVLARHCGPGDTLFVAWLLAVHYGLRLRVVLKSSLRLYPSIDLAAEHLPFCFVGAGGRRTRAGIKRLAASMSAGDAFLLFPEGGNFTWPRWQRAVSKLIAAGNQLAARVLRHSHTLPPHHGGATAALTGAQDANVLLLNHTAFTPDGRDRPWWQLPIHRTMTIRTTLVPSADVPREPAAIGEWLDDLWSTVDDWVAGHAS